MHYWTVFDRFSGTLLPEVYWEPSVGYVEVRVFECCRLCLCYPCGISSVSGTSGKSEPLEEPLVNITWIILCYNFYKNDRKVMRIDASLRRSKKIPCSSVLHAQSLRMKLLWRIESVSTLTIVTLHFLFECVKNSRWLVQIGAAVTPV